MKRWMAEDRPVVLLITALLEELEAAKLAGLARSRGGRGVTRWEERDANSLAPYWWGEYTGGAGRPWSVALARPTAMSGRSTAPIATNLVDRLRPSCLAMCGLCAGNPFSTALGDVVVADAVYEWDEGRHMPDGFLGDHRQVPLDPRWVRTAQEFDPSVLPSHGAASVDESMLWLLERLHQGQDPREHPARSSYFDPDTWQPRLAGWESEGLITRDGNGAVVITDSGTRLVRRRLYDDVDGPQRLPFRLHVAPMASGNAVVTDDSIWPMLTRMGSRKIGALEMEAATIATVAREREVPRWLVAKGVMDHAGIDKDDRYRKFAARASADVIFALLDLLVRDLARVEDGGTPAGRSSERSSSSVTVVGNATGPIAGRDIRYG